MVEPMKKKGLEGRRERLVCEGGWLLEEKGLPGVVCVVSVDLLEGIGEDVSKEERFLLRDVETMVSVLLTVGRIEFMVGGSEVGTGGRGRGEGGPVKLGLEC